MRKILNFFETPSGMSTNAKILLILGFGMFLTACAGQPDPLAGSDIPGFFTGIWHGLTIVFSLIGGLFSDIRIYAVPNTGWGYDFGYALGAFVLFGILVT
jgi:hypothetical protein